MSSRDEILGVCSLSRLVGLCCGRSKESHSHLAAGAGAAEDVKTAKIIYPRAGASKAAREKEDEENVAGSERNCCMKESQDEIRT